MDFSTIFRERKLRKATHNPLRADPKVPDGVYFPVELGLDLPKVNNIKVGKDKCEHHLSLSLGGLDFSERTPAHATPSSGDICFVSGDLIFNEQGEWSDPLIHEYCHILRGNPKWWGKAVDGETWRKWAGGHDTEWGKYMTKYGLRPTEDCTFVLDPPVDVNNSLFTPEFMRWFNAYPPKAEYSFDWKPKEFEFTLSESMDKFKAQLHETEDWLKNMESLFETRPDAP